MRDQHRDLVADALNSACLEESGAASSSSLERLLRQLVAAHAAIRHSPALDGASSRQISPSLDTSRRLSHRRRANLDCGEDFRLEVGRAALPPPPPLPPLPSSLPAAPSSTARLSLGAMLRHIPPQVPGRPAARASCPVSARSNGESSSSTAASASQLSLAVRRATARTVRGDERRAALLDGRTGHGGNRVLREAWARGAGGAMEGTGWVVV